MNAPEGHEETKDFRTERATALCNRLRASARRGPDENGTGHHVSLCPSAHQSTNDSTLVQLANARLAPNDGWWGQVRSLGSSYEYRTTPCSFLIAVVIRDDRRCLYEER